MATVSTPSASDVSEALASDKDPPCPLDASTNLVREQYALVELTPKPQSGVDLANATGVTITAVTGDFSASVLGWDASKITAQIFADSTASHNEVFTATLSYNGASDISYTGVLTVADETPAVNLQPHAVPGNNITVSAGTPVILDGRQSYHDDSNTSFSGTWFVSGAEIGLFHDYGEVELPAGTYTAQLFVSDYYGRTSSATITVTVLEFKRGDANEDGQVNVSDPVYLLSWLFQGGQAPPCVDAADANDDGSVNMSDGVYLNSWLFSTGPQPPQPGPSTCGEDPTIDSLSCDSYTPCQ